MDGALGHDESRPGFYGARLHPVSLVLDITWLCRPLTAAHCASFVPPSAARPPSCFDCAPSRSCASRVYPVQALVALVFVRPVARRSTTRPHTDSWSPRCRLLLLPDRSVTAILVADSCAGFKPVGAVAALTLRKFAGLCRFCLTPYWMKLPPVRLSSLTAPGGLQRRPFLPVLTSFVGLLPGRGGHSVPLNGGAARAFERRSKRSC